MDEESRARITQLYRRSLDQHGPTARGQRWASEDLQRERFRLLMQIMGPGGRTTDSKRSAIHSRGARGGSRGAGAGRPCSIADIGCGVGDFLGFLREGGWRGRVYDGFDIVPEMVDAARRKQRKGGGRFEVRDVLEEGFPREYDYVVASGTFNLRIEDHDRFFRRMIVAMYEACRRGVAFNVLQPVPRHTAREEAYDVFYRNSYYAVTPGELVTFCHGFCPRVELVESDRLRLETTVLLRRQA